MDYAQAVQQIINGSPSVGGGTPGGESPVDPIDPLTLSGLEVWVDPNDYPVGAIANGTTLINKGTAGNFTVSGTGLEVRISTTGSNKKVWYFDGNVALTTTNTNFFVKYHNQSTSQHIVFIGRIGASSDPEAFYGICGSNAGTSFAHGFYISIETRAAQPATQGFQYSITKNVGSSFPFRVVQNSNLLTYNTRTSIHFSNHFGVIIDLHRLYIDGDLNSIHDFVRTSANTTTGLGAKIAPSVSNPTYAFQIGANGNNASRFVGEIEQFLMYSTDPLSVTQVRGIDAYFDFNPTFGKSSAKYINHTQSITSNYILNGFYHKTADKSKTLFLTSRGPNHFTPGSDREGVQVLSTNDAASFPASYTVVFNDPVTSVHAGMSGGILPSGRAIVTYGKYTSATGAYLGMFYRHTENLETWGSENQITTPVTSPTLTAYISHDQGVLADNGDMIIPWYGFSGTSLYNLYVMRVSNDGTSFSHKLVYTSPTVYKNEGSVANLGNGKWLYSVRVEAAADITPGSYVHEYFLSEDDCETWVSLGTSNKGIRMYVYPHPPMIRLINIDGTPVLADYTYDRGTRRWYVMYVTVSSILSSGVAALNKTNYLLDLRIDGVNATGWRNGYANVIHPDNDINAEGVIFKETSTSTTTSTFFKINDEHRAKIKAELGI